MIQGWKVEAAGKWGVSRRERESRDQDESGMESLNGRAITPR